MEKANKDLRKLMKNEHVPVYAIAAKMGVHENTVFRRLRFELTENEKAEFCRIIDELKKQ